MTHLHPIRVYYEDTDAGGVVYYANYLKYAERGRTELLRDIGFENKALEESQGIVFVVRNIEADYKIPAKLDDFVEVHTSVDDIGGASVKMQQAVVKDGQELFTMRVTLACVEANTFKPSRLSEEMKSGFLKYTNEG